MNAQIASTGSYLPDLVVENRDLTQFPKGSDRLIESKTGVRARRRAAATQCTSDLGTAAARRCLARIDFDPLHVDAIILATSSPDRIQPATATRIQHQIGAVNAYAFDVNSVCTGSVYAIHLAAALIGTGTVTHVLVIAAELYSRHLNPRDFSTYPYFGDGAGAVLIAAGPEDTGIVRTILRSDGSGGDAIQIPAGGTMQPLDTVTNKSDIYFKMRGREVFEFATSKGTAIIQQLLDESQLTRDDISFVICHQANINILKELSARLGIGMDRFCTHLDRYGNTAAASVLIALDELLGSRLTKAGDNIVMAAFGGGLSWGATLIRF